MTFLESVSDVLKKATGGGTLNVENEFDSIAGKVPAGTLAQGLTHAFNSNQTPPFAEMLSGLFARSNPDQKAGLLNQIIGSIGPSGAQQIATTAGLSGLAGLFSAGTVTPQQAQKVTPNDVQILANSAVKQTPSIVDAAANFYAQHPALVKNIGTGALALLMGKITQKN